MILIINFFGRFSLACHFLLGNFIAVIPSHHCDISSLNADGILGNLSREERLTVGIPAQEDGTPASCHMFAYPQFHLLMNSSSSTEPPVVECQNGWEFDNSTFISTLATQVVSCFLCIADLLYSILIVASFSLFLSVQWNLVCDHKALSRLTTTIFFIGVMFGAAAYGSLSAMLVQLNWI